MRLKQGINMFAGVFVYAVLLNHNKANISCFILKLCQYEYGWGK